MGHRRRRARCALVARVCSRRRAPCCSIAAPRPRCVPPCGRRIERVDGNRVVDLHVWCIGLNLYSASLTVVTPSPRSPEHYKALLPAGLNIVHATVEVHAAGAQIALFKNRYWCMIFAVKPRPPAPTPSRSSPAPRVQRRRERTRASLLAVGARQFALRGIAPVSVEELIAEADVSRATFYGLFSSKYSLLEGILNPIFELATRRIRELCARPAEEAIDGLVDVYWSLWTTHRDGLLLIPLVDQETFTHFETAASRAARCAARPAARRRARGSAAQRQRAVLAEGHRAHGRAIAARL